MSIGNYEHHSIGTEARCGPKKVSQKIGDESRKYPIYFFIMSFAANFMRDMSHVSKHQWHRNQLAPAIEHPSRLNRRLERVQKTVVELEGEKDQWFLHNS